VTATTAELNCITFDCTEIFHLLKNLKVTKATGPDGISARVLRECAAELTPSLSRLFRISLQSGQLPADWKHGRIVAFHKGGKKHDPENYRPISLLPIASKVLESVVNRRLRLFLDDHNLLPDTQFGFRSNRSTLDMAVSLTQRWSDALDRGEEVRVVSLDLSRAFDRVWHRGLLAKLKACGVTGILHTWLAAFLSDRFQTVAVSGQESAALPMRAGVPQGSVLGPTLFLVFLRDMADGVESDLSFFADDSSLHQTISSKSDRQSSAFTLNKDLSTIHRWAKTWCAHFNAAKTHVLTISRARDASEGHPPLSLDNQILVETDCIKIVGLLLNQRLTWGTHVRKVATRCSQQLGALRRASFFLPRSAVVAAYKGTIRSRMEFLSPIWCNGPKSDLQLLHRLQDRALKLCGVDDSSASKMCLQPLQARWRTSSLALLHRAFTGVAPSPVCDLLPQPLERHRHTRASDASHERALSIPRSRTSHHSNSFIPSATRLWNLLPPEAFEGDDPQKQLQKLKKTAAYHNFSIK